MPGLSSPTSGSGPRPAQAPIPILLASYYLDLGGSERQLTETALRLDRRQFTPHVAVFRAEGIRLREIREAGIPLYEIGLRSFKRPAHLLSRAWRFRRYLQENRIAIAHSFDVPLNIFLVPVARAAGVPVVLSSQRASRDLTPGWQRAALRFSDRLADGAVVNCLAMRDHLIAEGVAAGRIHLCYNSVDTERFQPASAPDDQAGGLRIGTICGFRPEKGVDVLLRAFAELRRTRPEARLTLVGDGPEGAPLRRLAAELGLGEDCRFEPATRTPEQWMRRMEIFVQPSRSEALSNSLMEAMSSGCAVVASRVGGNPELVDDGHTGLLFPSGDAPALAARLRELAEDPERRRRMAAAARQTMRERFSPQACIASMSAIYRQTLSGGLDSGLLPRNREAHG